MDGWALYPTPTRDGRCGYGRTGGATRQVLWDWQWQHLWPATPEKTCVVSLQSLHTIQPCTNTNHTHKHERERDPSLHQHGIGMGTDTASTGSCCRVASAHLCYAAASSFSLWICASYFTTSSYVQFFSLNLWLDLYERTLCFPEELQSRIWSRDFG